MAAHTHRSTPTHVAGRRRIRRAIAIGGTAIGALAVLTAIGATAAGVSLSALTDKVDAYQLTAIAPQVFATPEPAAPKPEGPASFTLVAAGDVLPHDDLLVSANRTGVFDMKPLWSELDPWIAGADLALCHMEAPVAPAGKTPIGFPVFAAPPGLVPALKDQGWDGCSTASNHMLDQGWPGVAATLEAFGGQRMGAVGTAASADESTRPQLYRIQGGNRAITVAHLSWSYGTNGFPIPPDNPWSVNVYNSAAADASGIIAQAQAARDGGADVVIASVHCCVEYRAQPSDAQRALAQNIADSGLVDLIIGHHAHVAQPIEKLSGGPGGKGMWVAYGLGNYISNQDYSTVKRTEPATGLLLTATFTVAVDGTVDVGAEWTGVTVDRTDGHTLHVISDIPGGVGNLSAAEVAKRYDLLRAAVGTQAAERTTPPTSLADAAFWIDRGPWTAPPGSQRPETSDVPLGPWQ